MPAGFKLLEPSGPTVTITGSYPIDFSSGIGVFNVSPNIDLESYEQAETGVEVFDGSNWQPSSLVAVDAENPNQFYCVIDDIQNLVGKQWRLTSPVTSWTCGGKPLYPVSGTFGEVPMGMMSAKNAVDRVLTPKADMLK